MMVFSTLFIDVGCLLLTWTDVAAAPAHGLDVMVLHKHGHHFGGLPMLFWGTIGLLIAVFHLFLFKLIYNEYCSSSESALMQRHSRHGGRYVWCLCQLCQLFTAMSSTHRDNISLLHGCSCVRKSCHWIVDDSSVCGCVYKKNDNKCRKNTASIPTARPVENIE